MKNIKKAIEALLSHNPISTHQAKLVLEAPFNPEDSIEHETEIHVSDINEFDHLWKVIVLETPYVLDGRYKLSSQELMKAEILPKEFISTVYTAAVTACASATGLSFRKINDAMRLAVQKFVSHGLEYGLKEFTFFKENNKTYIGVIMRVQESFSLKDSEVKYFVRIAVPVY